MAVHLTLDERAAVADLIGRGLYLQAYRAATRRGPLAEASEPADRILGCRMARELGSHRLSARLAYEAYRQAPSDPECMYYHAIALLNRRGPLAAWRFMRRARWPDDATVELSASWLSLEGYVHGVFRDFDAAEASIEAAVHVCPSLPRVRGDKVRLLGLEERTEDALAAARDLLALRPHHVPAAHMAAGNLEHLGRWDEAADLLAETSDHTEAVSIWAHRTALLMELERYDEARMCLERAAACVPLADKEMARWLAGTRSDLACHAGDLPEAARLAEEAGGEVFPLIAESLQRAGADARRRVLTVAFVPQTHMTCAPATLVSLSRYWSTAADLDAVAEAICYAGTQAYDERAWADDAGFTTREFTVTWDAARRLIDRDVPFLLTTATPSFGHAQAVVGYDGRRGTLHVRDPNSPYLLEYPAGKFLEEHRSCGPRGMVMLPADRAHLLDGLDLPDAALRDGLRDIQEALRRHDRPASVRRCDAMAHNAPDHRLVLHARLELAGYDRDSAARLALYDALLDRDPDDTLALSRKALVMSGQARRADRQALLAEACESKDADPFFPIEYARMLGEDGREEPMAMRMARRAARKMPTLPAPVYEVAESLWRCGRREEAVDLFRFVVCLDDKNEAYSTRYFTAARYLGRTDEALEMLEGRFRRFGTKSGWPARTFFSALEELDRLDEAFAVLDEALAKRPDDADLLLHAAEAFGRHGRFDRAEALLDEVRNVAHEAHWRRTAAALAGYRGASAEALRLWRQVLEAVPDDTAAHEAVVPLIAAVEGKPAAVRHLAESAGRFPHNCSLHALRSVWLRDEAPESHEAAVRAFLDAHPVSAWARRELALDLRLQHRLDEAWEEADFACRLEPNESSGFAVRGMVELSAGRVEEARESFRRAVRLSVDNHAATEGLVSSYETFAERREALDFIHEELIRQVTFGDGLLTFRSLARPLMKDEDLLAALARALDARPDLWHAWSAVVRHLLDMGRFDDAAARCREATDRFPLVPPLWMDRAAVCRAADDLPGETRALERAVEVSVNWDAAVCALSEAYRRAGQRSRARRLLETHLRRNPLHAPNHGYLADVLWDLGEREAALAHFKQAVRLDPSYRWAWGRLWDFTREERRTDDLVALAREVTETHPHEANSWIVLSLVLEETSGPEERLAALDRAIALDPRSVEAYDRKAELLAALGRTGEALAACRPAAWPTQPPVSLRMREAWILAQTGRLDKSIKMLEALVAEEPGEAEALKQLAEAYGQADRQADHLQAVEQLARLAPNDATTFGYLGEAYTANGLFDQAKDAYRRAMAIEPGYAYAGLRLFDLHLHFRELNEARQVLDHLRVHLGGPHVLGRAVELACAERLRPRAAEVMRALCLEPSGDPQSMDIAAKAMVQCGWRRTLVETLKEAAALAGANAQVVPLLLRHGGASVGRRAAQRLVEATIERGGEAGVKAAAAYVRRLGETCRKRAFRRFLQRHRDFLNAHTPAWAAVGFAHYACGDPHGTVRWLSTYRERTGVRPGMLLSLTYCLRRLGHDEAAYEVERDALALPPDGALTHHRTTAALHAALQGRLEETASHLAGLTEDGFDARYTFLATLARSLLAAGTGGGNRRRLRDADRLLRRARRGYRGFRGDPVARRLYRQTLRRLARLRGGGRGALWYCVRWARS
jgi:tetratricopeptide (TPR) repeat protein